MNNLTPENINVATWKIPSPLGIIGSHANGDFNGMTASWITQVSMDPPLIGVCIDNKSVTFNLMNQSDFFTINMFSPEYTKVFVKFSKPAIILRIVVFPQPDGPSNVRNSPSSTSKEMLSTAQILPKFLTIFLKIRAMFDLPYRDGL